jgi:predicted RNA polymerase sigma factor
MTDTITIPPDARKAAFDLLRPYMDTNGEREAQEIVEDACLAMLREWPKAEKVSPGDGFRFLVQHIILPLTEPSNDK